MNKIFKVIWNKARNCYVVTSEIAKSHSKTKSETSKDRGYTLISTLAVLFLTGCVPVFAAVTDEPGPTDPNPARSAGIRLSSGWMSALEGGTATKMYDYGTPGNKAYDNTGILQWDGTGRYQLYTGTHLYGIALGNAANAYDPEVQTASGTALGDYSRARSLAVAVGPYASAEKIAAVAIGAGAKAAEFNSLAMMRQSYASGKYAAAIGTAAVAKGEASLAMGHSSTATGNQSIAIGTIAPKTQYDSKGTPIAAYDGVNNTQATADRAIALGQTAHATGVDSIAFGSRSTAGGASSIAYGTDAKACVDNAVAIGKSASAPTVNGVALGSNSRADRTSGEWGYNVKTEDGRTNGYTGLGGSALRSEYAAVSVGNEGHTRQITHVAAGSKDTDAVNVAQLRNVNLKVGANTGHTDVLLDSQTLKIQGDNQYVTTQAGSGTVTVGLTDAVRQKIDASANINLSNITNEGKTVIHNEAQKAVVVKGGSNTTVTSTVANGTKTYTVNGRDTTVSAVPGSRITVKDNGGIDANGNRHYEIGFKDCDLAKKTDIWTLQANGKDVPPSQGKVNIVNGENVTIEKSANGQIRISAKGGHDEDAVHYDISNGVVNKNSVTMAGSTYVNKTGGTHITNVSYATGNDGSEVVNVDYLTDQVNNAVTNTTTNITNNLTAKGMNFVGNDGQVIHKDLGSTLGIVGKNSNIQTANDNGKISIALAKNLTDITSISNGNTSIVLNNNTSVGGNGVTITGGNVSVSNNRITNVQNAVDSHDAVNKGQLDSKVEEVTNKGLRFDANVGGEQTSALGSKVTVKGDGTNIKTSIKKTGADTVIDVALGKDVTAETVTVTGKNGKDGTIGINGKDGVDGINGTNRVDIHVEKGQPGVNGTDGVTRIVYEDKTGGTHITNVAYATGNDGSEVVNVDYLTDQVNNAVTNTTTNVTNNLTAKGMNFVGNDGQVIHKNLGETLGIVGGGTKADSEYSTTNIKTVKDVNGNISVMMDKNLVTESVQVGKDGKDGKIGVSGKDGKDAVTVYGKDGVGHIGLTGPAGTNGKDGTNGIDLTVKNGYDDVSKGIKGEKGVDGTDGITRIVYEDKTGEHQVATMEDGMVFGGDTGTDIIKKLNNKVSVIGGITNRTLLTTEDNIGVVSDGTDNLKVRLAKDLRGITSISNGDTKITLKDHCEDAVTITGGNINVTNNRITNLKDGEDEHDAVNKGQLDKAVDGIKQGAFGVTADDGKSVKKNLGETVGIGGDGTNISTSVENGKVRVSLNKDVRVDTVTANKVTTGDTTVTSDGLVINGGPSVTKNGIDAGNKVITNVAAGRIGAGSTDAVNGGQLHDMADSISRKGFGVTTDDGRSIMKGLGETVAIGGDGTNVRTSVSGGKVVVGLSDKLTIGSGAGAVSIDGVNGNIGVGGVSIGRQGGGSYVGGLSNTTWDVKNPNITSGRAATEDQLKVVSDKISGGRVFQGDWGKVSVGLGDTLNLRGNAKNLSRLTDGNIAVVSNSAQDGYNIKLAKDINMGDGTITFTTSTTAPESTPREMTNGPVLGEDRRPGAPTVTSSMTMGGSGITFTPVGTSTTGVRLTGTGLNNGGQQLHGVAAGTLDDDAVNVSQLRRVQVKVDNAGSASAALAGLHPLAYDPIAPTQVMAAVGSYGNSTSVALGLAHYTNENTLLHVGASFGQQDNAVNAGVTYKFGRSAEKKAIPDRYKAGPISSVYVMQDEVTALKAENARIKHHEEELTEAYRKVQADNEEMKAQIALLMEKAGLK